MDALQAAPVEIGPPSGNEAAENRSDAGNPLFVEGPWDASRMDLSDTERENAIRIKTAVEESRELDNLMDFDYVQLAIVDQEDVERALERVEHFQLFRQEYGLQTDSYTEGVQLLTDMLDVAPEFLLSLSYSPKKKSFVLVIDITKLQKANIRTPDDMRILLGGAYTTSQFMSPDFQSMREGAYLVVECQDYDWTRLNMNYRRKLWQELLAYYPLTFCEMKYFHTGLFANLSMSLLKKLVPHSVVEKIQVGCEAPLEMGRLDSFYAIPSFEEANKRLLHRASKCLQQRIRNQKSFRLVPSNNTDTVQ